MKNSKRQRTLDPGQEREGGSRDFTRQPMPRPAITSDPGRNSMPASLIPPIPNSACHPHDPHALDWVAQAVSGSAESGRAR
jgi:hypothetical protein